MTAGQNNVLRGFRKERFSGRSMAYNSIELRVKLFDIKDYLLPGAFGLLGFNDVARVWADGETSRKWHDACGGGFYFIPYNMFLVSATAGFSSEQTIFNFTIGTKLNLVY
jgi:outer membrane protein assembly factor BamA